MANWNQPTTGTQYATLLDQLKERDADAAKMFDPAIVSPTNLPDGSIRWNSVNGNWQIKTAGTWGDLTGKYMIDVDKLDGQDGAYYLAWANLTGKPSTFAPSAHNHDDRYFTETEADGRFAGALVVSGNSIKLRNVSGADLATITVPYATSAGNAATVGGNNVNQNLRTTDSPAFSGLTVNGNQTVTGTLYVGPNGAGNSQVALWDDAADVWRSFRWNNANAYWQLQDATGSFRRIFHEGHAPTWGEVTGKPSTFTPNTHSHDFGTM